MRVDLHFHSNCSDGALSPRAVVLRAASHGAKILALTDHDQLSGLVEARLAANELGISFVNGVEISTTWRNLTIHIVGLNFDASNTILQHGLLTIASRRAARAQKISMLLEDAGLCGMYDAALAHAGGRIDLLSRTHFARELVVRKKALNVRAVFMDYLVAGKPGYVAHEWVSLEQAIDLIRQAGGVAVLAHPGRYIYEGDDERLLLQDFVDAGGQAIEVVTGSHSKRQYRKYADIARYYSLWASCGSDFHAQTESKMDVGKVPVLPDDLKPVWNIWY